MFGNSKPNVNIDLTEDIQLILKSTQALEGRFGLRIVICFMCGKKNEKLYRFLTHELYEKGKYNTETYWNALGIFKRVLLFVDRL